MSNSNSLKDRIEHARASSLFAHTVSKDAKGATVIVAGSNATTNRVGLHYWVAPCGDLCISAVCTKCARTAKEEYTCPGSLKSVCYHVMAAIQHLAHESAKQVSFCANRKDAERLLNAAKGAKLYHIGVGESELYAVLRGKVSVDLVAPVAPVDADFDSSKAAEALQTATDLWGGLMLNGHIITAPKEA